MIGTWVSIIPPIIALAMVLITRRVLLSLGTGIVAAAIILARFSPSGSAIHIVEAIFSPFWQDSSVNTSSINIIIFLILLGILTAFISLSGGSKAFATWAIQRIKSKRGAKILTVCLGVLIFVDDYFNALAVGQIARPVTDSHKVSRAKLAYLIDSTSAPICVISPISSWGAFLIGQLTIILASTTLVNYSALSAFFMMAPMNFYAISSLAFVLFFAWTQYDFGAMKEHEHTAEKTGHLYDPKKTVAGELKVSFPEHDTGKVFDLIGPIATLVAVALMSMLITGYIASGSMNIWNIFEATDVPLSLVIGGITSILLAIFLYVSKRKINETFSLTQMKNAFYSGIKMMLPAVFILMFAWGLSFLIEKLETGLYLSHIVEKLNIPPAFLPVIIFILAAIMAFSTGTSWGTFGILLPIAANIMIFSEPDLLLPTLAAVLSGAVFGDHCSPISDTTILSSTGAGANLMDHVLTQLPYALVCAVMTIIGYFIVGLTGSVWYGLLAIGLCLFIVFSFLILRDEKTMN